MILTHLVFFKFLGGANPSDAPAAAPSFLKPIIRGRRR